MQHTYFLFKTLDQVQRATPKWVELPGVTLPSKPVSPSKHFPESRFQQNLASRFILLLPQDREQAIPTAPRGCESGRLVGRSGSPVFHFAGTRDCALTVGDGSALVC